jgi:hypothetical protein
LPSELLAGGFVARRQMPNETITETARSNGDAPVRVQLVPPTNLEKLMLL